MCTINIWQIKDSWTRLKIFLCFGSSNVGGIKRIFSAVNPAFSPPPQHPHLVLPFGNSDVCYASPGDQLVSRNIFRNIAAICAGVERHCSRAKVNFMNDPRPFVCSALLHREGQGQHWHLLIRGGYIHSLAIAEKRDTLFASARVGGSHIYFYSISVVSGISPSPFKHCTFSIFSLMQVSAKKRWQRRKTGGVRAGKGLPWQNLWEKMQLCCFYGKVFPVLEFQLQNNVKCMYWIQ